MGAYLRPKSLKDALKALDTGELTVLAGGTDFFPARVGRSIAEDILDVTSVPEMQGISEAENYLRIGAGVTWSQIVQAGLPAYMRGLQLAGREVGGYQIQNAGTITGNICNASPAADGVPVLLTLDAEVEVSSIDACRLVPLTNFVTGNRRTNLSPNELVTGLCIPKLGPRSSATFLKLGARRYLVISIAMVAVVLEPADDGTIGNARIAVGACSEVAQRIPKLEAALVGLPISPDLADIPLPKHLEMLAPLDDVRGSADYRLDTALTCVRRSLKELGSNSYISGVTADVTPLALDKRQGRGELKANEFSIVVNGKFTKVSSSPISRLADVLRDELNLTGTKIGCNAGDCGACTVLLDGRQVCACLVPLGQINGKQVTTVEGLSENGLTSRLQTAFNSKGATQCGICTPGMLMAATELLQNKNGEMVTKDEVSDALAGVLCRCTGYRKIISAILAASNSSVAIQSIQPGSGTAVGSRMDRIDAPAKLDGTALYGADVGPTGSLWLRVVRSPYDHANFTLDDFDDVLNRNAGLVRVLTSADIPGNNGYGIYPHIKDQAVLANGRVRYRGDSVVALVGSRSAVEAVRDDELPIVWEPLDAVANMDEALAHGAPRLHENCDNNVLTRGHLQRGDISAGFDKAFVQAEGRWDTTFLEHAYIEPESGYAERKGDRIEIHVSTQSPYMDRDEVAQVMGFEPDRIRIIPTACGGGFGGKLDVSVQPILALAAWILERPVRCVYTRPESMAASTKRHPSRITARAGANRDGKLTAFEFDADFDTGAYASWGPTVADRVPVHASGPYAVKAVKAQTRAIHTNRPPSGAFRGFGVPQAALAHEGLMDDLAGQLCIDQLEFRFLNAIRAGDETPTSQRLIYSTGLAQCLEVLRPYWTEWKLAANTFNQSETVLKRGVGIGCMWYGIGNTSMSNPSTMEVGIDAKGRLTLYNGAQEIGQGTTTIMVQICADALGVPAESFHHVMGDTDLTLDAGKSSASRQALVSGNAARLAGEDLRMQILRLSNLGAGSRITIKDGKLIVTDGDAARHIDLAKLPQLKNDDVLRGRGNFDPPSTPLDEKGQGEPYATYGFAAQIAEVLVDTELGVVRPLRIAAAHDVGKAINPTQVEGQIHGGIAQGIGLALMEEYVPGLTENLHDYLIPTVGDVPDIECFIIEDEEPLGPYGAKGIGEPALIPTAPAILGAIHHATGVRIRRLPATPDRVRAAILEHAEQTQKGG
jgi:aldehyde oxidoreductase